MEYKKYLQYGIRNVCNTREECGIWNECEYRMWNVCNKEYEPYMEQGVRIEYGVWNMKYIEYGIYDMLCI